MNNRTVNRCLVAIALAGLLAGAGGCGMMEKPSARIAGVKIEDVSVTDATMLFDVNVSNPYSVPLPLSNIDYALASRGQQFLTGKADVQGTVPARGSKSLGVPIKINYLKLIRAVKGARPGAKIPYKADLGLSVDAPVAGPLRVPMSKDGELALPSGSGRLVKLKGALR